ncbi:MAG: hypothetical protein SFU20_00835 [Chitinophagaceae bacterium]|nr:hypothetical protein [Chitinophagaceae bacterium]
MDEQDSRISEEANHLLRGGREYMESLIDLMVIRMIKRVSVGGSRVVILLLGFFLGIFLILFLSLGAAFWLSAQWDSYILGFCGVGLGYGILILMGWAMNKRFIFPYLRDRIIRLIFSDEQEHKELS